MESIEAIYEHGVFRPIHPVALPENCRVHVIPQVESEELKQDLDAIHEVMSKRYNTGIRDLAARHNEHQP
jgi:predicted DNA-binding antitoxin AbrB/MazE fold protein